jgi:hypothetical protein
MHLTIAFSNCLPIPQGSCFLRSDAVCAAPAPPRNQMRPLAFTLELAWFIDLHQTTRRHITVESILYVLRSYVYCLSQLSMPWLRQLLVSLSRRKSWYDLEAINVGFLVDKLALGQVPPSEYFGFSPLTIIPPVLFFRLIPATYYVVTWHVDGTAVDGSTERRRAVPTSAYLAFPLMLAMGKQVGNPIIVFPHIKF